MFNLQFFSNLNTAITIVDTQFLIRKVTTKTTINCMPYQKQKDRKDEAVFPEKLEEGSHGAVSDEMESNEVRLRIAYSHHKSISNFYEKADQDYEFWSKGMNMHFGYWKRGINPFRREQMIEQMNAEVLGKMNICRKGANLADLGCGFGATARHAVKKYSRVHVAAVTIVSDQIINGEKHNKQQGLENCIDMVKADYCNTPFDAEHFDGVYSIESSCYAKGSGKENLVAEMYRVLKIGGRFTVADCFRNHSRPINGIIGRLYRRLCDSWEIKEMGEIHEFANALRKQGFKDVSIEDISWKVAPSVAHVPWVSLKFLISEMLFGKTKMVKERWNNMIASLLCIIIGLNRKNFTYYIVSGTKG